MKYPIGTKLRFKSYKKSVYPTVVGHTPFGYELEWRFENTGITRFRNTWTDSDVIDELELDITALEQYVLNKLKENGYG